MKLNFREIYEGWRNDLFPPERLKDLIRQTQEDRLKICKDCPFNSSFGKITNFSHCKDCGCPLKKKSACLSCSCPQSKWLAVLSGSEEIDLENKIKNHEPHNT